AALPNGGIVQAAAVVGEVDGDLVADLLHGKRDLADVVLAGSATLLDGLDAVCDRVAQHVLDGDGHALEYAAVDLDAAAADVEVDAFALVLGALAHDAMQAVGQTVE